MSRHVSMRWLSASVLALGLLHGTGAWAAETPAAAGGVLKPGARLAIVGDSITEQKLYSRFIEDYLTVCTPQLDVKVAQFGWSGERAAGFAGRMDNDLLGFTPTVVTTCYGMNDGGYRAFDEGIGKGYEVPMRDIVTRLQKAGATVVVGSPGAVDTKYYARGGVADASTVYNDNLARLGDIAKAVAAEAGMPFADVHGPMMKTMAAAKEVLGPDYDVCGRDGVHPGPNGHLIMAYSFLKGLGVDGAIGTISVDMKGEATASDGHKVLSAAAGKVEVESSRYPFCFFGGEKDANGTRSILPYLPFNADLNRFMLVVKNLTAERAKVTWGNAAKTFTKAELEQGVNLAAAFEETPFAAAFQAVDRAVADKQNFETGAVKGFITNLPRALQSLDQDKEAAAALELVRQRLWAKDAKLQAAVRAQVVPVKHVIEIVAETP